MTDAEATRSTGPTRPPGRYGRAAGATRPATGRLVGVFLALGLVAGTGVALLAYQNHGGTGVSATVTAFTTTADHVDISFLVQRHKTDKWAVCLLRARSASGAEVGHAEVSVPPGPDQRLTHRLPTSARPVTGEVIGCRYGGTD